MRLGLDPASLPFIEYCINKNDAKYVQVIYISKILGKFPIRNCGHSNIIVINPDEIAELMVENCHRAALYIGEISSSKRIFFVANKEEGVQGVWKKEKTYGIGENECLIGIYNTEKEHQHHGTFYIRLEERYFEKSLAAGQMVGSETVVTINNDNNNTAKLPKKTPLSIGEPNEVPFFQAFPGIVASA